MVYRVDQGRMGAARIDHNGTLIVTGALTRTGVFSYKHIDGTTTRELRHQDEVFSPESVASFVQVPVTDEHPEDGRITPDNVSRYMVGNTGDTIKRDGSLMKAEVMVRKQATIDKVRGDGTIPKRALSCGYTADVIEESGVYNGEKYDHRQTNIRGNHVAIVKHGRAGPEARLLLDSADAEMEADIAWAEDEWIIDEHDDSTKNKISSKISKLVKEGKPQDQAVAIAHQMARDGKLDEKDVSGAPPGNNKPDAGGDRVKYVKDGVIIGTGDSAFKLDKLELNIPDEAVDPVEMVLDQRDRVVEELTTTRTKLAETQGKLDALEEQKKDWDNPEKQEALAAVRQEVIATATHAGFKADEFKGKSNAEIKHMVVSKRWPDLKMDDLEDGYIQGRFDTVQDEAGAEGDSLEGMKHLGDVTGQRTDKKPEDVNDDDLSYRQTAERKMDNLHLKNDAELKEAGLN